MSDCRAIESAFKSLPSTPSDEQLDHLGHLIQDSLGSTRVNSKVIDEAIDVAKDLKAKHQEFGRLSSVKAGTRATVGHDNGIPTEITVTDQNVIDGAMLDPFNHKPYVEQTTLTCGKDKFEVGKTFDNNGNLTLTKIVLPLGIDLTYTSQGVLRSVDRY
jgi:hypothetical protein